MKNNKMTLKFLDVGGASKPWSMATIIMDIIPRPKHVPSHVEYIQQDIHEPWPFKDKEIDEVNCSHTLEDIKDPISVCKEMIRTCKKGRISVPSIDTECTKGIDAWPGAEKYTGYYHHRWLCLVEGHKIKFMQKTPITLLKEWPVNNNYIEQEMHWEGSFDYEELVLSEWKELLKFLDEYFKKEKSGWWTYSKMMNKQKE